MLAKGIAKWVLGAAAGIAFLACSEPAPVTGPVLVTSIEIQGSDITNGNVAQLDAVVLPANAKNKGVTWSVSNTTIATISGSGLLTAACNGDVVVRASAMDMSGVVAEKAFTISGVINCITPQPLVLNGTVVANPTELTSALNSANPGDSIYVKAGSYAITTTLNISRSGNASQRIYLFPYPGDASRPLFDCSSMTENGANKGIVLSASYWHIKGIDIYRAGDNGLQVRDGGNNIIEFCTFSECRDSGLQIDNGSANNLILNCDSYFNADATIENADGFACKLNAGTGNKFVGCRAWQNLDDGWDGYLRGTDNITTTYENCWSYKNGYLKTGAVSGGDGNGFKTGGSDDKTLKHNGTYRNCIAAANLFKGFDHNSNRGNIILYNCASHSNGTNLSFGGTNPVASLVVKNCAVPGTAGSLIGDVTDITHNSWQDGLICNDLDFYSVAMEQLIGPRKPNGDLPDILYLHLTSGSDLINKGMDVGIPFKATAPDLGAFESDF